MGTAMRIELARPSSQSRLITIEAADWRSAAVTSPALAPRTTVIDCPATKATLEIARCSTGAPGLPAIFPHWCFSDLLSLRGDRDPKIVIRRNIDRVVRVPMANAAINLDTPEDLLELGASNPLPSPER